jgi:hypothetical protein
MWLQVNTNYLHIFPRGSETVQDAEKLHQRLAGAATVQLVVSGAQGRSSILFFCERPWLSSALLCLNQMTQAFQWSIS